MPILKQLPYGYRIAYVVSMFSVGLISAKTFDPVFNVNVVLVSLG